MYSLVTTCPVFSSDHTLPLMAPSYKYWEAMHFGNGTHKLVKCYESFRRVLGLFRDRTLRSTSLRIVPKCRAYHYFKEFLKLRINCWLHVIISSTESYRTFDMWTLLSIMLKVGIIFLKIIFLISVTEKRIALQFIFFYVSTSEWANGWVYALHYYFFMIFFSFFLRKF